MIVKFNGPKELASKVNAFLVKFQTDSPVIPFMSNALETFLCSLMKKICFDGHVCFDGKLTIQINQVGSRLPRISSAN